MGYIAMSEDHKLVSFDGHPVYERRPGNRMALRGAFCYGLPQKAGIMVVIGLILLIASACNERDTLSPTTNDGKKWRLAYYEGGPYGNYAGGLRGLASGLVKLGWMEPIDIPEFEDVDDARPIWRFLSTHAESSYLEFVADAYWSAGWDDRLREQNKKEALQRLSDGGDIDLVIAMGTWAGQDLANDRHSVPTVVFTSSGPVQAGIIKSVEDSGFDHVMAEVDPDRYARQIRLFHDIVGFDRLGVVLEDSPEGRVYANVKDLKIAAEESDFEIFECHAQDTGITAIEARRRLAECYNQLAPLVDALWVGVHQGESPEFMPEILEPLFQHNVATWAQAGSRAVERGVLISIARKSYEEVGLWYATTIARILNGAIPRDLDQVFEPPGKIAINLETARRIDFDLPEGLLEAADEIYSYIEAQHE